MTRSTLLTRRQAFTKVIYRVLVPVVIAGLGVFQKVNQGIQYAKQAKLLTILTGLANELTPTYRSSELTWTTGLDIAYELASTADRIENNLRPAYELTTTVSTAGTDLCMIVCSIAVAGGSFQLLVSGRQGEVLALRKLDKAAELSDRIAMRVGRNDSLLIRLKGESAGVGQPAFQIRQFDVYCLRSSDLTKYD